MKTLRELLAEQELFAALRADDLDFLAGCCSLVHVRAGEAVFREGEAADRCFIIRTGLVVVGLHLPDRGAVGLATIEPGEMLGWSWLIAPHLWQLDATASAGSSLLAFDAQCLRDKLDASPRLGYQLMTRLAQTAGERLLATRYQLLDLYGRDPTDLGTVEPRGRGPIGGNPS